MKDFYSNQASPPRQNKISIKSDYCDGSNSLRDKAINQSNLLKQQFYNNLDFPKKDEIVKQIRNRSNRILSYSMLTDEVQSIAKEKQETVTTQEKYIIQDSMRIKTQSQQIQNNHVIEKQSTDILQSKSTHSYANNLKQKLMQQHHKQKSPIKKQNESSIFENPSTTETDNKQKNNQFTNINSDEKIMKKRSSLLLPKFDCNSVVTPQDYKVSSQNVHQIHSFKHKKRDRSLQKNSAQKYGIIHVHNTDLSQNKLPSLKDSFADLIQNHFKFNQNPKQDISPKQNLEVGENIHNCQDQSINGGSNNKNNNEFLFTEGEQQKKLSSSDRKLAVIKLLRNKIRNRQKSLPVNEIMIQNELNNLSTQDQESEQTDIKNKNQPNVSNQQIQNPLRLPRDLGITEGFIKNKQLQQYNDANDKDLLSKLLMKQQSLKLSEIKVLNQNKFEQTTPAPAKLIYQTSNSQKCRIQVQQFNNNSHPLEQIPANQSLIIKKNPNQFVYPQLDINQNSQQTTSQKKQIYSPKQIYKNPFPKDDNTFKNCQSFINKLLKKRYYQHKIIQKKINIQDSSLDNKEPQNTETTQNLQNTQKRGSNLQIEIEKINKIQEIENINEDKLNNEYEYLQKYYDEKYEQNGRVLLLSTDSNFKSQNMQMLDNSTEKLMKQNDSKEDFYSSSQKKLKSKKQRRIEYELKKQQFTDLKPWDDVEYDEVSLSFFHKTIYDPIKNGQNSKRHFNKDKKI